MDCYSRYTVKELLLNDFFMPEELIGLRVEIKNRETAVSSSSSEVEFAKR